MTDSQRNHAGLLPKDSDAVIETAIRKGTKRNSQMLTDRTNLHAHEQNKNKKRKRKVASDEEKENISPERVAALSLESRESEAVVSTKEAVQKEQCQLIFPCDIKRCRNDGHLLPIEYVLYRNMTMFSNEKKSADLFPNANYLQMQTHVMDWMRVKLYIWMTEVHMKFKLREVVLWASFQLCDRFLSKVDIRLERLQLVGCTSMWIACKYHEIYPPMAAEMIYISDNDFTKPDILAMERRICDTLSFEFSIPNAFQFLERFTDVAMDSIKELRLKNRVKWLARYAMERFNLHVKSLQYCPSMLAAGALFAALKLTSHSWTKSCVVASGYTASQLGQKRKNHSIFYQIKNAIMDFDTKSHMVIISKYKEADKGRVSMLRKKGNDAPTAQPSS